MGEVFVQFSMQLQSRMNYTEYLNLNIKGISFTWDLTEVSEDHFKF